MVYLSGIKPPSLVAHVAKEAPRSLGHRGGFSLRRKMLRLGGEPPPKRVKKSRGPYSLGPRHTHPAKILYQKDV